MSADNQLPLVNELSLRAADFSITISVTAPDNKRTTVKLEASIAFSPNAIRHNTELAANATSAKNVHETVFTRRMVFFISFITSPFPLFIIDHGGSIPARFTFFPIPVL